MDFEKVRLYLEKTINAFYNHVVVALVAKEFSKTTRIHLKPENNKLNLDIIFVISRLFTPQGVLVTRITLVYAWYMGRGYWEHDLPSDLVLDQKDIHQLTDFINIYLRDFGMMLTQEIFLKMSSRYRNIKFLE